MRSKKYFSIIASFLFITSIFGQSKVYNYQQDIEGITDLWHEIELPNSVIFNSKGNLWDLRIYCVNASNDTLEMPYLVRANLEKSRKEAISFEVLNKSENAGGNYYTFKLETGKEINKIDLDFENKNFESYVTLEGSQNQEEWFTIMKDYRVLSIKNTDTEYAFKELSFPTSNYAFYRLFVPKKNKPKFTGAHLWKRFIEEGKSKDSIQKNVEIRSSKNRMIDTIDITLDDFSLLQNLHLPIKDSLDYYRRYQVYYKYKNAMREGYLWRDGASGYLSSEEVNDIPFRRVRTQAIRVLVFNNNNQALSYGKPIITQHIYSIVGRFSEKGDCILTYGNKDAKKPSYDIAQFQKNIPSELKLATLGERKSYVAPPKIEETSFFDNSWFLFAVMAFIIGLVGWFTLGMMKGMKAS